MARSLKQLGIGVLIGVAVVVATPPINLDGLVVERDGRLILGRNERCSLFDRSPLARSSLAFSGSRVKVGFPIGKPPATKLTRTARVGCS